MGTEVVYIGVAAICEAYLRGDVSMRDFIAWEADLALDSTNSERIWTDQLALVAEEVADGYRDEADFRRLAASTYALLRGGPLLITSTSI